MKSLPVSALLLTASFSSGLAHARQGATDLLAAYSIVRDSLPQVSAGSAQGANLLPRDLTVYELDWSRCSERSTTEIGLVVPGVVWGRYVDFSVKTLFQPCGAYRGRGQYLSSIQVLPVRVDVDWPYNLNASAQVYNLAPLKGPNGPIARARVIVQATVGNSFGTSRTYSLIYVVRGDGGYDLERTWTFELKRR